MAFALVYLFFAGATLLLVPHTSAYIAVMTAGHLVLAALYLTAG